MINLIEQQEAVVFPGDTHHLFKVFSGVHHPQRVVGVDDQDAHDVLVGQHLTLQLHQVYSATVVQLQWIGDVVSAMMDGLGGGVGRIGGIGPDDTRGRRQRGKQLVDGIAQAIEKDHVLHAAQSCVTEVVHHELPGLDVALGGRVGVYPVFFHRFAHHRLHPRRNLLPLGHRVTDVFPDHGHAHTGDLVGDLHDLANFVAEVLIALLDHVLTHSLHGIGTTGQG